MLRRRAMWMVLVGSAALPHESAAQTATQVVRFQVNAVNQLTVSGNPATLIVNSATAGNAPASISASGGTYAVTTNEANQKITASLDQPLPAGVTLELWLAAPTGASSAGDVPLSTAAADVVTGISAIAASALPLTYRLSADPTVRMSTPDTRTVTFTIVSGT